MNSAPDLEITLQRLHESGIAAGVESLPESGMRVWIGDAMRKGETIVHPVVTSGGPRWVNNDAVSRWLINTAVRLFPESRFGLEYRVRR